MPPPPPPPSPPPAPPAASESATGAVRTSPAPTVPTPLSTRRSSRMAPPLMPRSAQTASQPPRPPLGGDGRWPRAPPPSPALPRPRQSVHTSQQQPPLESPPPPLMGTASPPRCRSGGGVACDGDGVPGRASARRPDHLSRALHRRRLPSSRGHLSPATRPPPPERRRHVKDVQKDRVHLPPRKAPPAGALAHRVHRDYPHRVPLQKIAQGGKCTYVALRGRGTNRLHPCDLARPRRPAGRRSRHARRRPKDGGAECVRSGRSRARHRVERIEEDGEGSRRRGSQGSHLRVSDNAAAAAAAAVAAAAATNASNAAVCGPPKPSGQRAGPRDKAPPRNSVAR